MSAAVRVAIPTNGEGGADAGRSRHFGRADSFTILEVVDGAIVSEQAIPNASVDGERCGWIVSELAASGVSVVIAGGMGPGPLAALKAAGVDVLHDDASATPREAVTAYLSGTLSPLEGGRDCGGH